MRAQDFLQQHLGFLADQIHSRRLACLFDVVAAVISAGSLRLMDLGRALERATHQKHALKCVDRLLGNRFLVEETDLFYAWLARSLIPREGRPILLIDWTDVGTRWAVLAVTLVTEGRGMLLYAESFPRRRENNPRVESQFLVRLQRILPLNTKPIIVSDAGFRGPWFRKVLGHGWDFVGRVRGRVQVRPSGSSEWRDAKSLWQYVTSRASDWGDHSLARYLPVDCRLIAVHKRRRTSRKPLPKIGRRQRLSIRRSREPWILATSLREPPPDAVVRIYATRMRIEETFRDTKCPRLGWGMGLYQPKKRERLSVLLLIATLAQYVALCVGRAAEQAMLHLRFQANSIKTRRILSLRRLGELILREASRPRGRHSPLHLDPDLPIATYVGAKLVGIR